MLAIDGKIAIDGHYDRIVEELGETHEACIGERHRSITVTVHESTNCGELIAQSELRNDCLGRKKLEKSRLAVCRPT